MQIEVSFVFTKKQVEDKSNWLCTIVLHKLQKNTTEKHRAKSREAIEEIQKFISGGHMCHSMTGLTVRPKERAL